MPCFHVFLLGLLLGYIALEYSLGVSIFVHVLILIASAFIHTWIVDGSLLFTLSLIFLIAGIILFVLNLKKVKVYFHESACSVSVYRYFFTSIWIVISYMDSYFIVHGTDLYSFETDCTIIQKGDKNE